MKVVLLIFLLVISTITNAQPDSSFYHKMDSLFVEMQTVQTKQDSLNKEIAIRYNKLNEQQKTKVKHEQRKNIILSIGLIITIIVISFIQ